MVEEIKDCIEGQRLLSGDAQWLAGRRVERIVELDPDDPELKRAWARFPTFATERWEYLATELIDRHWVHIRQREDLGAGASAIRMGIVKTGAISIK